MATPGAALDLLARARVSLVESSRCSDAAQRYVDAHLGALRAAAEAGDRYAERLFRLDGRNGRFWVSGRGWACAFC